MRSKRTKPVAGRRASLAAALSGLVHLVAFIALSLGLHTAHQPAAAPPDMVVRLVNLGRLHPPRIIPQSPQPRAARSSNGVTVASPPPSAAQAPVHPPSVGLPAGSADGAEVAAARNALRTSIGCESRDIVDLSAEERAACQRRRLATLKQAVPTYDAIPSNPTEAAAILRAAHCNEVWRRYRDSYSLNDFPGGSCADPPAKPR